MGDPFFLPAAGRPSALPGSPSGVYRPRGYLIRWPSRRPLCPPARYARPPHGRHECFLVAGSGAVAREPRAVARGI